MNFHLSFPIPAFEQKVGYTNKLLFVGSCFAENIGDLLLRYKFDVSINPNGILYNPTSISTALRRIIKGNSINESELFQTNDIWNSWEYHSRFSNSSKTKCLENINKSISSNADYIKKADWLFITFGSAFVYEHIESANDVANCHKVPQKNFTKKSLSTKQIISDYTALIKELKEVNPELKIVFTISPVRYVRDGVVENNLSKAKLIDAVHEIVKQNESVFYFPAYELVLDDLRDYRFFKSDLVHPNEQAIAYVFEKLMDATFADETKVLFKKIKDVITAKAHRPFNSQSKEYQKFQETYLKRCTQLQNEHPHLKLKEEIDWFAS